MGFRRVSPRQLGGLPGCCRCLRARRKGRSGRPRGWPGAWAGAMPRRCGQRTWPRWPPRSRSASSRRGRSCSPAVTRHRACGSCVGGGSSYWSVRGAAAPWSSCCAPVMWTATSTCYWRCPCPTPAAPCPASRACFLPATISSGCSALTRRSPGGGCPAWPAAGGKPGPCLRAARRIADRSGLQTTRRRGCERAGRAAAADPGGDARRAAAVLEVGAQGPGTRRLDHDQLWRHRDPRYHQARLPGLTRRLVDAGARAAGSHRPSARCVRLLTLSAAGGAPARKSMAEGSVIKRPLPPSGRAGWPGWKAIGLSG